MALLDRLGRKHKQVGQNDTKDSFFDLLRISSAAYPVVHYPPDAKREQMDLRILATLLLFVVLVASGEGALVGLPSMRSTAAPVTDAG